jgi:hypothetical protein
VPVQPFPCEGEHGSVAPFADREVDRAHIPQGERDDGFLTALAGDRQGPVPALGAERFDVRADSLRHPRPVQRKQRDQGVLGGRAQPGGDQERPDVVAVQAGRVRLVFQPLPADVASR